jgi:imidazolonepropionase-like amidohydrolase
MNPRNIQLRSYKLILLASLLVFCLCAGALPQNPAPIGIRPEPPVGKGVVALRAARLIDGTGAALITHAIVVVTDNRITAVGDANSVRIPSGAKTIDLGDVTLLPGFIDAHTHLIGRVLGDPEGDMSAVRDYESFGAMLGVLHARDTLMAGFTSVRNVGASGRFDDMALRKAINEGWTPGPRMETAGHAIGITGGHCDENGFRPGAAERSPMDSPTGLNKSGWRCACKSNTARM